MVYAMYEMFFLSRNFVFGLLCTLKPKNLKTFSTKPSCFPAVLFGPSAPNLFVSKTRVEQFAHAAIVIENCMTTAVVIGGVSAILF